MSIAIVLSWYLCGAWAAGWMVHRGHSATPWWVGAALLGGMLWAFAFPCARISGAGARWIRDAPQIGPHQRVVVGLLDEAGDVAGTATSVAGSDDHLVVLHRVGREASSTLVDTGETELAEARCRASKGRWPGPATLRVGSGPAIDLVTDVTPGRTPDLVVRGAATGWTWRLDMRRSVELGTALGIPILHAPAQTADDRVLVSGTARQA